MATVRAPGRLSDRHAIKMRLRRAGLETVCEQARCPNMCECFGAQTATFLILGKVCTRGCRFCAIEKGRTPEPPDPEEPARLAETIAQLGLSHAVITSVTRDDLPDGGAGVFAACIRAVHARCPDTSVEVLIPDFAGRLPGVDIVLDAGPAVFNHNVETVPRLYSRVRPGSDFERSLKILRRGAQRSGMVVKSGLMVGLGERPDEVVQVLEQLADAGCRVVTIGQYLRPTRDNLQVAEIVDDTRYAHFRQAGADRDLVVVAGPLVRSSYQAARTYATLSGNEHGRSK